MQCRRPSALSGNSRQRQRETQRANRHSCTLPGLVPCLVPLQGCGTQARRARPQLQSSEVAGPRQQPVMHNRGMSRWLWGRLPGSWSGTGRTAPKTARPGPELTCPRPPPCRCGASVPACACGAQEVRSPGLPGKLQDHCRASGAANRLRRRNCRPYSAGCSGVGRSPWAAASSSVPLAATFCSVRGGCRGHSATPSCPLAPPRPPCRSRESQQRAHLHVHHLPLQLPHRALGARLAPPG